MQGRIWLALPLAACSPQAAPAPEGEPIACALDGASRFAEDCTLQRDGELLVIHHPDGGFRRLDAQGQSLDGADPAAVTALADGGREIAVGADRYRLRP